MKTFLVAVATLLSFSAVAQDSTKKAVDTTAHPVTQGEPTLTFILTVNETNALFYALEKSDAEYNSVIKPLRTKLEGQIRVQVTPTSGPLKPTSAEKKEGPAKPKARKG